MKLRFTGVPATTWLRLSLRESVAQNERGDWRLDDEADDDEVADEAERSEPTAGGYPWEDVGKSRGDWKLQLFQWLSRGKHKYMELAKPCPSCGAGPRAMAWVYFVSPVWTWEHLCGRAGWLVVCDKCNVQSNFFCERLN